MIDPTQSETERIKRLIAECEAIEKEWDATLSTGERVIYFYHIDDEKFDYLTHKYKEAGWRVKYTDGNSFDCDKDKIEFSVNPDITNRILENEKIKVSSKYEIRSCPNLEKNHGK